MAVKVDLHVHTRHSDRSAEWVLRRLDFPASCTDPVDLYASLKQRGMKFVTFTDNNTIDGCLAIADKPDAFISEKVTAHFPDDKCKIQLLVWGLNEAQHTAIAGLRHDIFDLQRYLAGEGLAHSVAHPLYQVNQQLTPGHVEQLILLFRHFESINGLRDALLSRVAGFALARLTKEKVDELASRHNLEPTHPEPWRKVFTAGSEDHGGIFPAAAFTEVAAAASPREFLDRVIAGDCRPCGSGGTPIALSHSLYNTIFQFAKERFKVREGSTLELVEKAFSRFMEGKNPTEFSFREKLEFLARGIVSGKIFELAKPGNASLWGELSRYLDEADFKSLLARQTAGIHEPERRAFVMASMLANQLAFRFFQRFVKEVSSGNLIDSVQSISAMVPVLMLLSPYIYAFRSQAPSRPWLAGLSKSLTGEVPDFLLNRKRVWVTDTLDDVNGVATTIRKMTTAARDQGHDVTVITCASKPAADGIPLRNFQPIGEFELPEYELQKLSFPPILEIVDYLQSSGVSEVIISTPGPTGLAALLGAKMLGLRTTGIYHTDFPQYVRILTDDSFLETLTWNFMQWFYSQFDTVFVNSDHYRQCLSERGIPDRKIKIFPRGLDLQLFSRTRRDPEFWRSRGLADGETGVLYVGRVSREKDLDVLAAAYAELRKGKLPARLLIVGDGPYREHLEKTIPSAIFTGLLSGETLATAYASADVFAFPSTTDTFGNVVLEAQASGLPCVVSDQGGPRELIEEGVTGMVTRAGDTRAFTAALRRMVADPALRQQMAAAACDTVRNRNWPNAFRKFWNASPESPA